MTVDQAREIIAKRIRREKFLFVWFAGCALICIAQKDAFAAIVWILVLLATRKVIDLLHTQLLLLDDVGLVQQQLQRIRASMQGQRR